MLAEACLCLVHNRNDLPTVGGVLTPAAAFGEKLIERLQSGDAILRREITVDDNGSTVFRIF